ncbi:hypothetical protein FHR84_000739 [Actinopolyspora biskrensis]|uniref:Uncharacterized protein n=1 Tax=Actinopolyspora biskrensis TaxID=1470178 RepID=A0A852YWY4_9ACTN|nr:hypothetical protein [Actinopolyspora biskrensis]NYH77425.1 hypothetical protein [Actinopolyspora biskrensis]
MASQAESADGGLRGLAIVRGMVVRHGKQLADITSTSGRGLGSVR